MNMHPDGLIAGWTYVRMDFLPDGLVSGWVGTRYIASAHRMARLSSGVRKKYICIYRIYTQKA